MKTFRQLKEGDEIETNRYKKTIPCDVTIKGHHYILEELDEDEIEIQKVVYFSHDNEENWRDDDKVYIQLTRRSIAIPVSDLDKTEYGRFKIIQDNN